MRRAVYIIMHRRLLPVVADSRTGHRRDGDEDDGPPPPDEDSRPPARRRQRDRRRPWAQNRPSVFWPRMSPLGSCASSSTSRTRSVRRGSALDRGTKNTSHAARRTPSYGRTLGRLARGGAEETTARASVHAVRAGVDWRPWKRRPKA